MAISVFNKHIIGLKLQISQTTEGGESGTASPLAHLGIAVLGIYPRVERFAIIPKSNA